MPEVDKAAIRRAFQLFDTDGDGALSVEEMQAVLKRPGGGGLLSDEDVQNVINDFDQNGDGVLQYEEFVQLWLSMTQGAPNKPPLLHQPQLVPLGQGSHP